MSKKYLSALISVLTGICILITTVVFAYAVEDSSGAVSSSAEPSSAESFVSSENTPTVSSEISTSSESVSIESSSVASSVASETVSETQSVVSESGTTSSKTQSKTSSSKKSNTSSKKATSSKKQTTSKSTVSKSVASTYSRTTGYAPTTPDYDNESGSAEWEGDKTEIEEEESSSGRELSELVFNPKKIMQRWIWLPIIIALICIGILVFTNFYLFKNGKHTAKSVKDMKHDTDEDADTFDDSDTEEYEPEKESGGESDPYSADNFFNFDDENK